MKDVLVFKPTTEGFDMSGFMPYLAESGRSARIFELALNGPRNSGKASKVKALRVLERTTTTGDALAQLLPRTPEIKAFIKHLDEDFFGKRQVDGRWQTGFWGGWYIPKADQVVHQTALDAVRLALGIDAHGNPTRDDQISILWVCNVDGFQAVVRRASIRQPDQSGLPDGLVTITMLTPAVEGHAVTDDLSAGPFGGNTGYACPPTDYQAKDALWLVGQRKTTEPEEEQYVQSGPVVTVSPAYEDGGA